MKVLEKIGFALLLVTGALAVGGDYLGLHWPWLYRVALLGVGFLGCLGGIRSIRKGEVFGSAYGNFYRERHTGLSARLIGVVLILGGAIVIALSLVDLFSPGGASAFLSTLAGSPRGLGVVLGLAGLLVAAFGIVRVLSGSGKATGSFARHVELSFKVGGVFSLLAGLAMLAIAAGLLLAPGPTADLLQRAVRLAKDAIIDRIRQP